MELHGFSGKLNVKMTVLPSLMSDMLCSVREKLVLLEPVELKDNRDPVERPVLLDLLDLLEHRFVCHFDSVINRYCYLFVLCMKFLSTQSDAFPDLLLLLLYRVILVLMAFLELKDLL